MFYMPRAIVCCFANSVGKKIILFLIMIKGRILRNNWGFCVLLVYLRVLSFRESLVKIELINYIGVCDLKIVSEYLYSVLMCYVFRAVSYYLLLYKLMGTKIYNFSSSHIINFRNFLALCCNIWTLYLKKKNAVMKRFQISQVWLFSTPAHLFKCQFHMEQFDSNMPEFFSFFFW